MPKTTVYRTELTPVSFLRRSAAVFPDKPAVVHGDRRYSFRQFEERVNRFASRLRADGLQKHDRVALLCPNIPTVLEAHFAVPAAGGILVPINTRLTSQEIDYILHHSGARFLFVDAELAPIIEPIDTSASRLLVRGRAAGGLSLFGTAFDWAIFEPAHFAMERKMLESIKAHAEGGSVSDTADTVQLLLWCLTFVAFVTSAVLVLAGR